MVLPGAFKISRSAHNNLLVTDQKWHDTPIDKNYNMYKIFWNDDNFGLVGWNLACLSENSHNAEPHSSLSMFYKNDWRSS